MLFIISISIYESESEVAQSCLTLCYLMDCSLPGSSVHRIFQARVLNWVAISFSRGSSRPRDQTWVSLIVGRRFTVWATRIYINPFNPQSNTLRVDTINIWFPSGAVVKNLPAKQGTRISIPGSGRSPGEGNGNALQYSCLGNPMDRGA